MLRAQGERAARYLVAEGEAAAIARVNAAVKASKPTPEMLAYQYVQNLPEMAKGDAATMWMIPSQFGDSLENFAKAVAKKDEDGVFRYEPSEIDTDADLPSAPDDWFDTSTDPEIARSVAMAEAAAKGASALPEDEGVRKAKPKPGVFDMVPESEGGAAPRVRDRPPMPLRSAGRRPRSRGCRRAPTLSRTNSPADEPSRSLLAPTPQVVT